MGRGLESHQNGWKQGPWVWLGRDGGLGQIVSVLVTKGQPWAARHRCVYGTLHTFRFRLGPFNARAQEAFTITEVRNANFKS